MKNITDLFSSLVRISHMLVAEGNFPPSCKLQPIEESLVLFICRKQRREVYFEDFFGQFPVSSICVKNVSFNAFS